MPKGATPPSPPLPCHPHTRGTLHDVVMPTVGELPVLATHVQPPQVDLVWLAVLEFDEFAQTGQELGVPVGAVLVGQDGELVAALQRRRRGLSGRGDSGSEGRGAQLGFQTRGGGRMLRPGLALGVMRPKTHSQALENLRTTDITYDRLPVSVGEWKAVKMSESADELRDQTSKHYATHRTGGLQRGRPLDTGPTAGNGSGPALGVSASSPSLGYFDTSRETENPREESEGSDAETTGGSEWRIPPPHKSNRRPDWTSSGRKEGQGQKGLPGWFATHRESIQRIGSPPPQLSLSLSRSERSQSTATFKELVSAPLPGRRTSTPLTEKGFSKTAVRL